MTEILSWVRKLFGSVPTRSRSSGDDRPVSVLLIEFLVSQLGSPRANAKLFKEVSRFESLPANQQEKDLPRLYLLLENQLVEGDPLKRISRRDLQAVVRSSYSSLLAIPGFDLIFEPVDSQELMLCRYLLQGFLSSASGILGSRSEGDLSVAAAWLVEMMKGRMWVESELNRGSTFHFILQMTVQDKLSAHPVSLQPEQLRDLHALIVDDNFTNRRVLFGMLTRWGMRPTAVDGGRAALQALEIAKSTGHPFPLMLLDGQMPDMDGFALAERIQKDPGLIAVTIMMLTSAVHLGDAARCRELGISAYLVKPIRQAQLLDGICQALNKASRANDMPLVTRHALQENLHHYRVLLAEDNAVNQTLALRLLERRGYLVTVVSNGLEAVTAFENKGVDVILMDIQMPEMDGFEATAAIRAKEKLTGGHIPIIAMTAHALKGDQEQCIAAGMDGYVSKPIRTSELFSTIESTLAKSELDRANVS